MALAGDRSVRLVPIAARSDLAWSAASSWAVGSSLIVTSRSRSGSYAAPREATRPRAAQLLMVLIVTSSTM